MCALSSKYGNSRLSQFVRSQWSKVLCFLRNHYDLDEDVCKDIFQDSFVVLYDNIRQGKLDNLTSSLSTYFIGICRNKALAYLRLSGRNVNLDMEEDFNPEGDIDDRRLSLLLDICSDETSRQEQLEEAVRTLVSNLPHPCDKILWGFYRDNLSIRQLAEIYGYSEGSAKVIKHRCLEKFSKKFRELKRKIFD